MNTRPRTALVAVAAVATLAVVGGLLVWLLGGRGTTFEEAVALAPAGSERVTWTDWTGVRRSLDADLGASTTTEKLESFMDEAFTADLSSTSILGTSAVATHEHLGFSPATLDWELFAQSDEGAAALFHMPDGAAAGVAERLESLGWRDEDGVWVGGPDVLASVSPVLTPELQHFVVLADEGLVVASDQAAYARVAADAARGSGDRVSGLDDVAERLSEPLSAVVYSGANACEKLAMGQADDEAQAEADQLVDAVGGVHPLTAFAMGAMATGGVRVALEVEDASDAEADARARAALATGPAPGQGGDFSDRFTVEKAAAKGRVITLDLVPGDGEYVMSDLSSGPVLFATC